MVVGIACMSKARTAIFEVHRQNPFNISENEESEIESEVDWHWAMSGFSF